MPTDTKEKNLLNNNCDGRNASEYASLTKSSEKIIDAANDKNSTHQNAIEKITVKYDSLGKLKSSFEKLDLDGPQTDHGNEDVQETLRSNDKFFKNKSVHDLASFNRYSGYNDVSEQDLFQVEAFFRSHKTTVYVCPTLAHLYFSTDESSSTLPAAADRRNRASEPRPRSQSSWQFVYTGIPVLLLDSGETRSRSKRRIQIVLAEKGTGFLLWKDTIDNLTNYKAVDNHFHTMFMSSDHRKMVGLSFGNVSSAREFYERIEELTSDPSNISLSGPSSKAAKKAAAKKKKKKTEQFKLPKKTDISQPCCFQHVIRVDLDDREHFVTLTTLMGRQTRADEEERSGGLLKEKLQKYKSEPVLRTEMI